MLKKFQLSMLFLLVLSLLLGACAPVAAPTSAVVETVAVATEAPVEPTPLPPTATAVPPTDTPEPPPDFEAIFSEIIAGIPADKGYGSVKPANLNEEIVGGKAPFLVDVQEPAEIEKGGFIEGAVNIPVKTLLKNLDKLPGLDEPIVIYCASGHRGAMAMSTLKALGYTNVRNIAGGLTGWKKAELPLVTGEMPAEAAAISTPIVEDQALFLAFDEYLSNLPEGFLSIKPDALNENLVSGEAPVIIDVRSPEEWSKDGYIEGAINLPLPTFMENLDQIPTDQPVVIYCASGHRGAVALTALKMLGYEDVKNLAGGLGGWKAAQFPVAGVVDWAVVWKEFFNGMPEGFYSLKADALNTALVEKPPFLLDVRETAEIEKDGYIGGAVHIAVRDVLKNLDKLPAQDQPIVIYCASGHRGSMAMAALRLLGYSDVKNLAGGLGAWKTAEFPVETGSMPAEPTAGTAPEVDPVRFAGLDGFLSSLPEGFYSVKPADLNTELAEKAPLLIDVRPEEEIKNSGSIEGSTFALFNTLLDDLSLLPADKATPVVMICQSGHRGAMAMMALRMLGWTEVRSLNGGINGWVKAELPVVK